MNWFKRYAHWLHTQWPAGHVEALPEVNDIGETNVPGVYVVGDLKGIPLLKFSVDTGARAVRHMAEELRPQGSGPGLGAEASALDLVIIGGGVAGMSAALEARSAGLNYQVLEASETFFTIVNFPKAKPIYTYPKEMTPAGKLKVSAELKESLLEELRSQTRDIKVTALFAEKIVRRGDQLDVHIKDGKPLSARRVIVAIGRSGNFRKLNVPGEDLDKVYNRLYDPHDYAGQKALVVGGGDSALETAIALAYAGADVTVSYRQKTFSRAKPENIEQISMLTRDPMAAVSVSDPSSERVTTAVDDFMREHRKAGRVRLLMGSHVQEIRSDAVLIKNAEGRVENSPNDIVFTMIGREPPLDFFRRSGLRIAGEWTAGRVAACASFVLFCVALYNWKSGGMLSGLFYSRHWFPTNLSGRFAAQAAHPENLFGTFVISASSPSFWYTLAYSLIVITFGFKRIRRRKTPYVRVQTLTLMAIQVLPLFLLPEMILPWLGHNHLLPTKLADALFPVANYGHGREYWRSYGFILAWPLMVYNVFTGKPLFWWLVISFVQTFVFIPAIVYLWGKGAYCGWICSCGALAETLGDTQRHKMPHGPGWNRLNLAGQAILAIAFLLLGVRITGWIFPNTRANWMFDGLLLHHYKWLIDVGLAGVLGYGLYFWYSGRVWCRFFCPLAALMHIYARFSRFRILAEKKKCISCNVCTSVCHQGIDVMNFANKGLAMNDPECVRCSACVSSCPTGVLTFGQVDKTGRVLSTDPLPASLVQMTEFKS